MSRLEKVSECHHICSNPFLLSFSFRLVNVKSLNVMGQMRSVDCRETTNKAISAVANFHFVASVSFFQVEKLVLNSLPFIVLESNTKYI